MPPDTPHPTESSAGRRAAILAGRRARAHLADAMEILQNSSDLPEELRQYADYLSAVVRLLFALEVRDGRTVGDGIRTAQEEIDRIHRAMRDSKSLSPVLRDAAAHAARALAILHPVEPTPADEEGLSTEEKPRTRKESLPELARAAAAPKPRPSQADPEPIPLSRKKTNRRATERASIRTALGMQSESNFFVGESDDLSDGGVFIATAVLLPLGTELKVSFLLPSGTQVVADGRVSWVREQGESAGGMGVTFEGLTEANRAEIRKFVEKRDPIRGGKSGES